MKPKNAVMLLLTSLIWGTAFVAQSVGMDFLEPFTFNGVRSFIGGVTLLPCIWLLEKMNGKPEVDGTRKDLIHGGIACGLLLFAASSLQQLGILYTTAGKGGNIKRITEALDPRGYEVQPIASPEPHEKARHYLWRFWTRLPKSGHIAIFDRTWYGRVMVERLEGFCSENDWQRAYNEINAFEKELKDWGAVIIKFWVQIDKDTQLARFQERQNNPEKQWKITDEDWRNREKWDEYEVAVNEMLQKTNTEYAPWHILESVDKKYARIKALKIVIEEIKKYV